MNKLKKAFIEIKKYFNTNKLSATFFITGLINACIVRFFTIENYFAIKPILADIVVLLIIISFCYFIKPKHQYKYYLFWSILLSLICMINSVYFSNYLSFASVSLLKNCK